MQTGGSMKNKILATTTVLAAIVGLSHIAKADPGDQQFIPAEELAPEIRQQINSEVMQMTKHIHMDWDSIVVGINEKGEISIRSKLEVQLQATGGFSCYGSKTASDRK